MKGVVPEWFDMSVTTEDRRDGGGVTEPLQPLRAGLVFAVLACVIVASALAVGAGLALVAGGALGLFAAIAATWLAPRFSAFRRTHFVARALSAVQTDPSPHFLTDYAGLPLGQTPAAHSLAGETGAPDLSSWLARHFASPEALLVGLRRRAVASGTVSKAIQAGPERVKIIARRVGSDFILWRVERFADEEFARKPDAESSCLPKLSELSEIERQNTISFEEALPVPLLKIAGDGALRIGRARRLRLLRCGGRRRRR